MGRGYFLWERAMIFKMAATRITPQQQAAMAHARKRNRMARVPASPTLFDANEGVNRERLPIDTDIDMPIDNPGD